ncbi:DNA replication protein DnaC [Clostridia bacterium]|nr:DNA replication protein DnaC [Clostridia bacterium]
MALTNTQYDSIMRSYEKRQRTRRILIEKRQQELYDKSSPFRETEVQMSSVALSFGRLFLEGDTTAISRLKAEITRLSQEKSFLIQNLGYPKDYLTPPYECNICKDTGYVDDKRCPCFRQQAIDLVYNSSNLSGILEAENFKHFSFSYYSSKEIDAASGLSYLALAQKAVNESKSFIERFDTSFENLFFYGDTGVGKTFLSHCVAKELLDLGHSVIYVTAFDLFSIFEKNTFQKKEAQGFDYQNLFDCDLLMIDDLGTEFANSFTNSQLFLCLNERILRQKSTLISTNLNMPKLSELYSERLFSRIMCFYTMLKLAGDDIRIVKKLNGGISHAS